MISQILFDKLHFSICSVETIRTSDGRWKRLVRRSWGEGGSEAILRNTGFQDIRLSSVEAPVKSTAKMAVLHYKIATAFGLAMT
jgi:hypothetical protein